MRGLPAFYHFFRNEFNKFNNTRARMLDSIYQMTLNYFEVYFRRETLGFCHMRDMTLKASFHNVSRKFVNY